MQAGSAREVPPIHSYLPETLAAQPYRVLEADGSLAREPSLELGAIRDLYARMVAIRKYDQKATAMQLQGRLATYSPFLGQEACQIGAVAPLTPEDWLVATYRDAGAMWFKGFTWESLFLGRMGDERGGRPGDDVLVLPPSITVGGHMVHAVGLAWAERLKGSQAVALTMFGEGATSEGDFHEAMNFAAVFGAPTVFFCQNNQYAISAPRAIQTASESIAQKALAYGMQGHLVDGNDLLAVHEVTSAAADRARAGEGPTLIEALTYRRGPHTTADDPQRYRAREEEQLWEGRDPLERVRSYLTSAGQWDDAWEKELLERESENIEKAVAQAEALAPLEPEEFFDAVFARPTPHLRGEALEAERRREYGE